MKKIIGDFDTTILLEDKEPQTICKLGQGEKCCAYLVMGADGFECCRMNSLSATIMNRLEKGTMNAKGEGRWEGCPWENKKKEK